MPQSSEAPALGCCGRALALLPIVSRWDIPLVGSLATGRTMGLGIKIAGRVGSGSFLRGERSSSDFLRFKRMGKRGFFI